MWYSTLAGYFTTRTLLQITAGSPSGGLAQKDVYGELTIHLHNSCRSFTQALAGRTGDIASAGLYLPQSNEIHVWMDERAAAQYDAQFILGTHARLLQELDAAGGDSLFGERLAGRVAAGVPPDRISEVLFHELVHWVVHASFSDMPWLRLEDAPALGEGFALFAELIPMELFRRDSAANLAGVLSRLPARGRAAFEGRLEGLRAPESERYRAGTALGCPRYEFGSPDWACVWLRRTAHGASSPRELIALRGPRFFDAEHLEANYADAWALVRLFGQDILTKAVSRHVSLGEVVATDDVLATPWSVMQRDIRLGAIPQELVTLFRPCK
jgi:hypothetical protein